MVTKNSENKKEKVLTAAQKIEGLEKSLSIMDQALFNATRQIQLLQDAVTLLNDKVGAMVIALSSGMTVTEELINQINSEEKVKDMKSKVEKLLSEGVMTKSDVVTKNSFLVVREIDEKDGKILNPRLQFVARILNEESMVKVLGKKAGDSIKFDDNSTVSLEIEEVYEINQGGNNQNTEQKEVQQQA